MTIVICLFKIFIRIIYFFLKLLPTKSKVVMISRQSNEINLDFKLLGKELEKKYEVIYLCKTLKGKENSKIITKIKYLFHMFKQMYHLATSKVCILDSYCIVVSILKHKKDLTVIQIWHSNGTMKKFGYTALDKEEGNSKKIAKLMCMHRNYDIVLSSSSAYVEHLEKGFNISKDKIMIYSLPRIDLLSDKNYEKKVKSQIYVKYPELKDKKVVIYAPTFRSEEEDFEKHLKDLINNFNTKKSNLVIKLHPLSKISSIDGKKGIIFDKDFSTFDMLFVADKLISDYSCVIYEAGVRNIELYFYAYDIEQYKKNRGLAIDYDELPGYTATNSKQLVLDLEKKYNMNKQKNFINKYMENTQNCTKKIVKLVDTFMVK